MIIKYIKYGVIVSLLIFLVTSNAQAFPQQISLVSIGQEKYVSPEDAIISFFSAYMAGDLVWHYQTLTSESSEQEKEENTINNLDPMAEINIFKNGFYKATIVNKFVYLDSMVLVVEITDINGDIYAIPYILIKENDLWRVTRKYVMNDELSKYMKYIPKLFLGHGQKPSDVNSFLAYYRPQEAALTLPTGTKTYPLQIYYGSTIIPTTFTATLDSQDISSLFLPVPSSDQMVSINLKPGRNVMLLSIDGKKLDGKTATDSDRLVFIVP